MIEVRSMSRYYGERCAVDDVSFRIEANEVVGFLGLNGAGKTTSLKILAGLLTPSSGQVTIDGVDIAQAPRSVRERIGFLPENPPLYQEMTVSDFLRYMARLRGMSSQELAARLPEVLERTHLTEVSNRVIQELSHGYQKRVGIAQAIIHRPALVILDEPISGLDPVQIVEMRSVIRSLSQESTVLVSSHILSEISQTCDRILLLHDGHLSAQGTEEELAASITAGHRYELTLRGSPDAIRAQLEGMGFVESSELAELADGTCNVGLTLTEDATESLVAKLVGAGIGVRRLVVAHDELEDIFLDLTREGDA